MCAIALSALALLLYGLVKVQSEKSEAARRIQRQLSMRGELEVFDKGLAACVSEFSSFDAKVKIATHLERPYKEVAVDTCKDLDDCGIGESEDIAYTRTETEPGFYGTPTADAIGRIAEVCAEKRGLQHPSPMLLCYYLEIDNPEYGNQICQSYLPMLRSGRETSIGLQAKSRLLNRKFNSEDLSHDATYVTIVRGLKANDNRIEASMRAYAKSYYEAKARAEAAKSAWALKPAN